jgi:hypothetical protein
LAGRTRAASRGPILTLHGVVFAILCLGPAVYRPLRVEDARERAGAGPALHPGQAIVSLGSVEIHREFITAAARWIFAAKL